jgi:superoxide reductase
MTNKKRISTIKQRTINRRKSNIIDMAVEKNILECVVCGAVVEVIEQSNSQISCCGKEMKPITIKHKSDDGNEKHYPVIEKTTKGLLVKIGSIKHPMEEEHSIRYIELLKGDSVIKKVYLKPGEEPEVEFELSENNMDDLSIRAFCNKHGLWSSK